MLINFSILQIISFTTLKLLFTAVWQILHSIWVCGFCYSFVALGFGVIFLWVWFFSFPLVTPLHHVRNSAPFSLLQLQQVRNLISPLNMLSSCPAFYMLRTVIWTRLEVIKASSADPGSWFTVLVPCFCPYLYILPPSLQRQHIL